MKCILIYNNLCYLLLATNAAVRLNFNEEVRNFRFLFTLIELFLQLSQVTAFAVVMLKFKKIEITIDPKYKTADEILGKIK